MADIAVLSRETIDKIAAGEVIERPASVVKELAENAIDAGASAVTIEIRDGGSSLIRITDNGCGIPKDQAALAFLRHSTSKIQTADDLRCVSSLGFRGEALSSISAIAQVELITKTARELTGIRYVIEGSVEKEAEEIGAPDGTTFLVRNLFYNTPARRKFLKTAQTEAAYVTALAERLALSRPDISFQLIVNGQPKLHTSGNSNVRDAIYQIYGRETAASLLEMHRASGLFSVCGWIGKPAISRGNRNFENCFVNRRYVRSELIAKSVEDAYKGFLMQRQYPFFALYFDFEPELLDVNVHPAKMEIRFRQHEEIYESLCGFIRDALSHREHIRPVSVGTMHLQQEETAPEMPKQEMPKQEMPKQEMPKQEMPKQEMPGQEYPAHEARPEPFEKKRIEQQARLLPQKKSEEGQTLYVQEELRYEGKFLSEQAQAKHRIIGQLFETYWLVEYSGKLFIIDQHAAHEKVLYERMLVSLKEKEFTTQYLSPPIILTLGSREVRVLSFLAEPLRQLGFDFEPFGGREYAICGVPANLFHLDAKQAFLEILDTQEESYKNEAPELVLEKIASMACKAAVKGNCALKHREAAALIAELLQLKNPYFCPHGRPTIIAMDKQELEKKFKRIV